MRVLTRICNAVQRLIEHTERDEQEELGDMEAEAALRSDSPIQLLGVGSGSAVYPVSACDGTSALRILGETGKNLAHPADADWDSVTLSSVEEISAAAKTMGCTVEIRRSDKDGEVLARITPESYREASESAFVTGVSSVYGYLERIGGATRPHCGLRVATQRAKMVICHVASEDLVRKLGPYVYSTVRVSGEVTWFRRGWRIKTIDIQAFEPPRTGSIREALNDIYEAGGKAWDDVDDPEDGDCRAMAEMAGLAAKRLPTVATSLF